MTKCVVTRTGLKNKYWFGCIFSLKYQLTLNLLVAEKCWVIKVLANYWVFKVLAKSSREKGVRDLRTPALVHSFWLDN